MMNKYLVKLYVKLHYLLYYIRHPKKWLEYRKLGPKQKELVQLYIGRVKMKEDKIDYKRLGVYGGMLAFTVWFWYSVFTNGLLVSILWLVVLAGIVGICINMWNMRA